MYAVIVFLVYSHLMLKIVQFGMPRRQAFVRGMRKGFAAPLLLFSDFEMDESQCEMKVQSLPKRRHGSVAEDWKQVGQDIKSVIEIEQTTA